jgi:hypothetical protein
MGAQSGHLQNTTEAIGAAVNALPRCADGLPLQCLHAWGDHGACTVHVTINAKACAGFDPMSQTFYIWFDASIKVSIQMLLLTQAV